MTGGGNLLFTCLGYSDHRESIGRRSVIDVVMSPDATQLDELVVIGYGAIKKSDLTGAVASVKGDDLKKAPVATVGQALQGKVAGVTVTSNTGQPGSDISIRIRGVGSVNAGVSPLYVVDGMIVSDIGFLSPNDIASTEVLKDASSAAIYGSRAANGVILITTKSASASEKATVTFEAYAGVQQRWRKLDLMGAHEHFQTMLRVNRDAFSTKQIEIYENEGFNAWLNYARIGGEKDFPVATDVPGAGFDYASQSTDWQDAVFRDAAIQNYYLSVDSGSRRIRPSFSVNWFSQDGTIIDSYYNRLNLHYNASTAIKDWLKLGSNLNFSTTDSRWALNNHSQPGASVLSAAMAMAPWDPTHYPAGAVNYLGEDLGGRNAAASNFKNVVNPFSMAKHSHPIGRSERFVGSIFLELTPFKGFVFRSDFNFDLGYSHNRTFRDVYHYSSADQNAENSISQSLSRSSNVIVNNIATYSRQIKKHDFSVMAGHSFEISDGQSVSVSGKNLLNSDERFWSFSSATTDFTQGGSYGGQYRRMSFIGRVNYDYDNRYLLTFNWRSDGNRAFRNHPWGHFPSVAAAWKLSEEKWFEDVDKVSLLKVRLGWGLLGNDSVSGDLFTMTMDSSMYGMLGYPLGANDFDEQTITTGAAVNTVKNLNGRWEISEHYNLGVDVGVLDDRLTGSVDLFIRDTKDMLLARKWPNYAGVLYPATDNIGTMRNSGFELQLKWQDSFMLGAHPFHYSLNGNLSFVRNEIVDMNGADPVWGDKTVTDQGFAVGSFWGYETDGIFRSEDEIYEHFKMIRNPVTQEDIDYNNSRNTQKFEIGDVRYVDQNGDGILDDQEDMVVIGNPFPKFTYGLDINLAWGPIDLSMFFQGVYGNTVYNALRERTEGNGLNSQLSTSMRNAWSAENPNGSLPNPNHTVNFWQSDRFLEDASYLRLKNLQIGYSVPDKWLRKVKINTFRIYLSANNLLTFTKYSGYDPEVYNGVDYGNYPQSRTFMLGVNFNF